MDKHLKGIISFNGYKIKSIDFKINDDYKNEFKGIDTDFDFKVNAGIDSDGKNVVITVESIIFKDYKNKNKPFYLDIITEGYFSFECTKEEFESNRLIKNSLSILFPYIRSSVTNITTTCGFSPLILPTININEFVK
ncbi:protein-export chaperone SecB [Clostridium pasteurianum]|uniref:protein-export chaperone SecB n=1 Tax=Clostridium pasteurianum TaxID=1501 RepID=UPI0022610096|nr:protein-export chaperone SecB [Clostridium pasteurianum]UZW12581.1 protein-export chaperone SecB [Clostridium pasteurianum]